MLRQKKTVRLDQEDAKEAEVKSKKLPRGLLYLPAFVTPEQEQELLDEIYGKTFESLWERVGGRRVLQFGYRYDYADIRSPPKRLADLQSLFPPKMWALVIQPMLDKGILDEKTMPNQAIINEYLPGQGIMPHTDHRTFFGEVIATLRLKGEIEMGFTQPNILLMLERGSLTVMRGHARHVSKHSIERTKYHAATGKPRTVSLSITLRQYVNGDKLPQESSASEAESPKSADETLSQKGGGTGGQAIIPPGAPIGGVVGGS